jgi:MFS family permease
MEGRCMYLIYLINFLLAISTTIGMTIIPFLVTESLGYSIVILGLIEGSAEFLSNIFRLVNGVLFDKVKNKRLIFVYSTGLAFVSKIALLFPASWAVILAKVTERIANGAFASPRDAYVAERAVNRGFALSLLSVSKTAGCVLGPLIVSISTFYVGNLRENVYIFVLVCCALVFPTILLSSFLNIKKLETPPFSLGEIGSVLKKTAPILILTFLFFLGRFNDGLMMVYLKQKGYPEWFYLSTIAIFNFIMLISSPFMGREIDRGNFSKIVYLTIIALGIYSFTFWQIDLFGWCFAITGLIMWGIQRTGAQIVFSYLIFNSVSKENYGTAIGLFYIITGLGMMIASFISGYLAKHTFSAVFVYTGTFSLLALVAASVILRRQSVSFVAAESC